MKHYSITVKGRVQGVFYRDSTKDAAATIGIAGTVENRSDGSVYIEAEGTHDQLNEFVSWCRKGPPRAQVTSVEITEGALKGFSDFKVLKYW